MKTLHEQINEISALIHPDHDPSSFIIRYNNSTGWNIALNWRTFQSIELTGPTFEGCIEEVKKRHFISLNDDFIRKIKENEKYKFKVKVNQKNEATFTVSVEEHEIDLKEVPVEFIFD